MNMSLLSQVPRSFLLRAHPFVMRSVATRPASTLVCPSCSTPLPTRLPTCPKCSHIAPISSEESYHALLDVPESPNPFVVDARTLRRNFLQAQRVCHPDAWSGKGQKEQAIAAAQSSLLNKAYQTLLNPVQRAQYLLSKRGEATQETDQVDNHELIMDVMDAREELEDANTEAEIETVRNRNEGRVTEAIRRLEKAFANQDYTKAKEESIRLKYWQSIEDAARAKQRET